MIPPPKMRKLVQYCERKNIRLVIGADVNSHHISFGSTDVNVRGEELIEYLLTTTLDICNVGNRPTFVTRVREEVLDVTMATMGHEEFLHNWQVSEEPSLSDHALIKFCINHRSEEKERKRNPRKTNWETYGKILDRKLRRLNCPELSNVDQVEEYAERLEKAIRTSFHASCPITGGGRAKKKPPWPEEVIRLRQEARRTQRRAYASKMAEDWDSYRDIQREFKRAIRRAETKNWREFCEATEQLTPVARLTRVLRNQRQCQLGMLRKSDGSYTETPAEALDLIMGESFPDDIGAHKPMFEHGRGSRREVETIITRRRVKRAIKNMGPYKAAGPDEIYPILLHKAGEDIIGPLKELYRACLMLGYVPTGWRKSKVVFLPKPGKPNYDRAGSFRPVSLTSFLMKILEKVLAWHVEGMTERKMHTHQYAYRKGRSTEAALHQLVKRAEQTVKNKGIGIMVCLDIEGAFNRASLSSMNKAMQEFNLPWLIRRWTLFMIYNRQVEASCKGCTRVKEVGKGTPQGGVLSPLLWNMIVNGLLEELNRKHPGVHAQAYADDVTLWVAGADAKAIRDHIQRSLRTVEEWVKQQGLSVNPSKTELMVVTRRRKWEVPPVRIGGVVLEVKKQVTYLGVIIDHHLLWKAHCESKVAKSISAMMMCRRAIGNTWGLNPKVTRWIYTGIIRPILSYAACIWSPGLGKEYIRKAVTKVQRAACLLVTGSLRSTPTAAMEVLLGLPPVDIYLQGEAVRQATRLKMEGNWSESPMLKREKWSHLHYCEETAKKIPELGLPADSAVRGFDWKKKHYQVKIQKKGEAINWHYRSRDCENHIMVFTDGSGQEDRVGAGIHLQIGQRKVDRVFSLGRLSTVNQAEMIAILKGSQTLRRKVRLKRDMKVTICSDSQASLKALQEEEFTSKLTRECHEELQHLGRMCQVQLRWTPGHEGIEGNERADELAKRGTRRRYIGPEPCIPLSKTKQLGFLKGFVEERAKERWGETEGLRQSKLAIREQKPKDLAALMRMSRKALRGLVGILTGHCNLGRHLHVMGIKQDPICPKCGLEEETPDHLVSRCPRYFCERMDVFGRPTLGYTEWRIFHYPKISAFLRRTGRLHEFLNV